MAITPDIPSPTRRALGRVLVPAYLALIFGAPLACIWSAATFAALDQHGLGSVLAMLSPFAYLAMACMLCRPHVRHVVEARMPVDLGLRAYFHRRFYGLCWTAIYYSGPLYYLILSWPTLKTLVFRAFGYRGPMNFTIYPDTWLRDLPLVHFGEGSYLSNKATIGSNMIFIRNGKKMIEVGSVRVGNNALVGHLTMVGPSTVIEDDVQIGVGCGIGRRSHIGAGAIIGDVVVLDHGSRVDAGCVLPTRAYVGMGCRVRRETDVAPAGSILRKQSPQREPVTA